MSGSAAARLKRANRLLSKFYPPRGPKQWCILLEAGEPIPEEIRSQFQKGDHVVIEEFPSSFDPSETIRCSATSWPLYGSSRDVSRNQTIVVERPRNGAPLSTIEEVGFARQRSYVRIE